MGFPFVNYCGLDQRRVKFLGEYKLIIKENKLIEGFVNMSKNEYKLILYLISNINKNDENFITQRIKAKEFAEILNLKGESFYNNFKEFETSLLRKKVIIQNERENKIEINWLSNIRYLKNKGILEIDFNDKLKPYLLNLDTNTTEYFFSEVSSLKSIYSIRIYELLKQYKDLKSRTIELEKLKNMLGATNKSYKQYNNFKRKVLKKAKEDIKENENTTLYFEFEEIKEGRKIVKIKFNIKKIGRRIKKMNGINLLNKIKQIEQHNEEKIKEYDLDAGWAFSEGELITLKTKDGEETSIYFPTRDEDNQSEVDPFKYYNHCDFDKLIADAEEKGIF